MKKDKFVQDAKADPSRYYRNPFDVIRDRRLSNGDRLEILAAWELGARESLPGTDDPDTSERLDQEFRRVRDELQRDSEEREPAANSH